MFACLLAVAVARPDSDYYGNSAASSRSSAPEIPILRDSRIYPSDVGEFRSEIETGDGTIITQSGSGSGPGGAVEKQGTVEFTFPDGQKFELSYVADAEGGYQPKSDFLPVAPAFPHPIPQFVLDQIAFAQEEDEAAARSGKVRNDYYDD